MRRFLFKLAGHLGMTVRQVSEEMSADELMEWQAYDRLDPIGSYRTDINFARLMLHQFGQEGDTAYDWMAIDPYPMTDNQREQYEAAKQKAELDASMQRLLAKLGRE